MGSIKNSKIQVLRALAIIAVVMIHTCPLGYFQVVVRPFINFSVALFLFLSGYLTKIENSNWRLFFKKRIIRVIIPYFIWTIVYTTVNNIGELDLKKYIFNFFTAQAVGVFYYIFVYIQLVLLTPFICKIASSKYRWICYIVSPIFILINYYFVFSNIHINKYFLIIYDLCCFEWLTYYYLGLILGNKIIEKKYNVKKIVFYYILSIILQIFEGYIWLIKGQENCGTQLKITSFLTSILFIFMCYWYINNNKIKLNNKKLIIIGDYSFGIYIMHLFILMILNKFISFWKEISYVLNSLIVLFSTLICILVLKKIVGNKIGKFLGLY